MSTQNRDELAKASVQTEANYVENPQDELTRLRQKTDRNVVEGLRLQELEIGEAESKKINSVTADEQKAAGLEQARKEQNEDSEPKPVMDRKIEDRRAREEEARKDRLSR